MPTATKALRDVELVTVGRHGGSVIGPGGKARAAVTEVTRADLEAMLAASQDLAVDAAPVKIGHDSSLNGPLGDGQPAYGWVRPTRIARNAAGLDTLYGDLVGMPAKLADVAPAAFRRRSVEIAWDAVVGQTKHRAVLAAVALLGIAAPAVKTLADVLALYSAPDLHAQQLTAVELGASAGVLALLSDARLDDAARAVVEEHLAARDTATVPAPTDDDAETPPQTTAPSPTPEAPAMPKTYTDEDLRKALSLEADADVDKALAELAKPATPGADATGGTGAATTGEQPPATPAPATTAPVTPAPAATPAEAPVMATLSAGVLEELQREAAYGRGQRLASVLDNAVRAGRITPAERGKLSTELGAGETVSGFAAALERDEAMTTTLLSSMAPRFATSELGAADAGTEPADAAWDAFTGSLGVQP